jgi:hypothetical protein
VEWDVVPPKDRNSEATSLQTTGTAIKQLSEALQPYNRVPDVDALCLRFAVPLESSGTVVAAVADAAGVAADAPQQQAGDQEPAVQDTALNGAQVDALAALIGQVAAGQLPRDSALEIIIAAFNKDRSTADRMLGSVGRGFVPTSVSVDVNDVEPEDDQGDGFEDDGGAEVIDITEAA